MDVEQLYVAYSNGDSLARVAALVGKDPVTVRKLFEKRGLRLRTPSETARKYPVREDFFDEMATQEQAYFLGLLLADGYNNTERGHVVLSLKEADRQILDHLTRLVQPTKPLQHVDQGSMRRRGCNTSDQYRMVIASRPLSEKLVTLGCVKSKTFGLAFPSEDVVPHSLLRHFVRGYFDGDGSVCNYMHGKYPKTTTSITGTERFLSGLQGVMLRELGFQPVRLICRFPERNNGISALCYSGRNKCAAFRDWLYADATIALERKKAVFYAI